MCATNTKQHIYSYRFSYYGFCREGTLQHISAAKHTGVIRALNLSSDGSLLLTGGEDKELHITHIPSNTCIKKARTPKKISACALLHNSKWAFCGDKFGDVFAVEVPKNVEACEEVEDLTNGALGHLCSVITELVSVRGDRYGSMIVSG